MNANEIETEEDRLRRESAEDLLFFAKEIEYFETHDVSEELANSPEVHFEISPQARRNRYPLAYDLAAKLDSIAAQRGTSAQALLNEWVREKMGEAEAVGAAN